MNCEACLYSNVHGEECPNKKWYEGNMLCMKYESRLLHQTRKRDKEYKEEKELNKCLK